ncbi:MAG TPA: sugar phosphate isomerase/epimerase [Actinomycetota bacterium]|jgi:sugar phosphate isomerase/epimerase|nr:sugar phosphate isomerase/epimerase [Actinomycetota bacterium]
MCTGHDDPVGSDNVARLSRRGFLRTAATTAAVVGASSALAGPALAQEAPSGQSRGRHQVPSDQISIQLFTLRDQLAIDLEGTLQALHEIGYTRIEHAGFVGRTVQEFKAALDAAGLWASSGHVLIPQPFDPAAWSASLADANTLGSRYIVHPFFGINFATGEVVRTTAPWRAFARDLNRAGRMARDAGLKLGYHNHNWEFFRLTDNPSRTAYDVLTDATDPDLVHLEMDLFWVTRGARDPVDLIRQNKGRVLQFHVKDMNREGSFEDPGQGLIDFARIFRYSKEAGVKEYIVERDDAGTPPRQPEDALDTARVGYQFLRTIRF